MRNEDKFISDVMSVNQNIDFYCLHSALGYLMSLSLALPWNSIVYNNYECHIRKSMMGLWFEQWVSLIWKEAEVRGISDDRFKDILFYLFKDYNKDIMN